MDVRSASPSENGESVESMEIDVPLFLMSKFCDTALKELSNVTGQVEPRMEDTVLLTLTASQSSTLFSNVLSDSQFYSIRQPGSCKTKRKRQHKNNLIAPTPSYPEIIDYHAVALNDTLNCSDLMEPESQQLSLQRKLTISRHVKPSGMAEFMGEAGAKTGLEESMMVADLSPAGDDISELPTTSKPNVPRASLNVQERLDSYLPVLKSRIANGKWQPLTQFQLCDNANQSENEIGVFYGILEKSNSVKSKRLERLFDSVGVAALPLQSISLSKKLLYLQDGTEKVELYDIANHIKYDKVVSGIAIAIVGKRKGSGIFVEDVVYATPCSPEWPMHRENNIEMIFASGMFLGNTGGFKAALDLFQDYLLGLTGSAFEQKEVISQRSRLFLVGNSISNSTRKRNKGNANENESAADEIVEKRLQCMDELDEYLRPILESMEVFIVPGENDPTFASSIYPQPPLHPRLFEECNEFSTLKRLTNPARLQVSVSHSSDPDDLSSQDSNCSLMNGTMCDFLKEDVSFLDVLLQSGKNLKETMDYCDISCPIEMGLKLLQWGHLHPSYCDTRSELAENLLRLQGALPNLVVIGNVSEFKVVNWNGVKVIGVPSFHKTNTAVVLTRDFDVIPLTFKMA